MGAASISAFAIFTSTGYTFDYAVQPRIGVRFDATSGGQSGGRVRDYYPMLYANMHFGENPFIAPINLYQPSGVAYAGSARVSGRYVGQQPAIKGAWAITDHFNIAMQAAVLIPGTAAKNYATKGDEYYFAIPLNSRF